MPEPCDSLIALAEAFDERAAVVSDIGRACYQAAATMARQRAQDAAGAVSEPVPVSADAGTVSVGLSAVDAAMAAELDWFRNRRGVRGGSWGMPPRAQVERLIAGAEPVIRADERANLRALLPYHVPCCEHFAASAADLLNDHGELP